MEQKNLNPKLKKEFESLMEERMLSEKINEKNKMIFSEQLKKMTPKEIKNTIKEEKKISLWGRIKRVLGMN
jgi:ABC-type uncharacterized transport system ATPase subunit